MQITYPKSRIDALTDGIFAVAMTLLVLDVRLPEDFKPQSDAEMLSALAALAARFLPYVCSFLVLGVRWLSGVGDRAESGPVSQRYGRWWLLHLLLVTCLPFSTMVLGRYASFAPAMWLYAGNTLLMAIVSYRMIIIMPDTHSRPQLIERKATIIALAAASVVAIAWSMVAPLHSPWSFLLVLTGPVIARSPFVRTKETARVAGD